MNTKETSVWMINWDSKNNQTFSSKHKIKEEQLHKKMNNVCLTYDGPKK